MRVRPCPCSLAHTESHQSSYSWPVHLPSCEWFILKRKQLNVFSPFQLEIHFNILVSQQMFPKYRKCSTLMWPFVSQSLPGLRQSGLEQHRWDGTPGWESRAPCSVKVKQKPVFFSPICQRKDATCPPKGTHSPIYTITALRRRQCRIWNGKTQVQVPSPPLIGQGYRLPFSPHQLPVLI